MCRYAKSVKIFFILLLVVVHLSVANERELIDKKKKLGKDHRIYQPFVERKLQPLKVQQEKKLQAKSKLKEEKEELKEEKKLEEKQRLEANRKVEEQLQRMEENILKAQRVAETRKQHEQRMQQEIWAQLKQREHQKLEEQKRIEDLKKVEERWKLQEEQQVKELQNIEKMLQRQDQEKEERMQKQLQHELQKKEQPQRGRQEEKPTKYNIDNSLQERAVNAHEQHKQQEQENVKQKQREIKVQLESLNGHLYDYFKKRLQIVENELSYHKLNDLHNQQKRYPQICDKNADAMAPNKRSELSTSEDNFYKNYKNRIDKIDKDLAIGNRKLMSDRLARSFFDWYKNFLHTVKERKASK
uniref:Uncharacterized protein n=1 Tax=Glossina austeni TaxID=7395 RepID=A0A1A9UJU9_GLOAU